MSTDDGQSWENNDGSCTRCIGTHINEIFLHAYIFVYVHLKFCPIAFLYCICLLAVHGFNSTKYHVSEGATLVFEVMLLVKGEVDPDQLSALPGIISTQSITASWYCLHV